MHFKPPEITLMCSGMLCKYKIGAANPKGTFETTGVTDEVLSTVLTEAKTYPNSRTLTHNSEQRTPYSKSSVAVVTTSLHALGSLRRNFYIIGDNGGKHST